MPLTELADVVMQCCNLSRYASLHPMTHSLTLLEQLIPERLGLHDIDACGREKREGERERERGREGGRERGREGEREKERMIPVSINIHNHLSVYLFLIGCKSLLQREQALPNTANGTPTQSMKLLVLRMHTSNLRLPE